MFCVTSLCYYITGKFHSTINGAVKVDSYPFKYVFSALNASNLAVSRYLYVAITGMVDLPSYLVPVVMLRYTGRRVTTMSLFFLTGIALLLVLVIPEGN